MAPLLFTVPGLDWQVQSYGFFMGLALVVAWVVALSLARADRLPTDVLGSAYVGSVVCGLLAARVAWLAQHPGSSFEIRSLVSLSPDGLAPFAGIAVALMVSAAWASRRRIPVTAWFDAVAPAFAVGAALERVGALLAGTGYGRYAPDWPLAISFPVGSPALAEHSRTLAGLLAPGAERSLPVHPTQLYGVVLALGGVWLVWAIRRRRRFSGQAFLGYAIYLVLARIYVEEWFRADAVQPVLGPFNPGQVGAAAVLVALVVLGRARAHRATREKNGLRLWEGGRWSPRGPGEEATAAGGPKGARKSRGKGSKTRKKRPGGKGPRSRG